MKEFTNDLDGYPEVPEVQFTEEVDGAPQSAQLHSLQPNGKAPESAQLATQPAVKPNGSAATNETSTNIGGIFDPAQLKAPVDAEGDPKANASNPSGVPKATNNSGSSSQPSNTPPVDPFDPMNLGITTDFAAAINVQASSKPFENRKPNDQEYFRTSPHKHHRLVVGAIADKQDMGRVYVVSGAILKEVTARFPRAVRAVELVLTVTQVGAVLVWPVPLADDRGGTWNSTHRSACDSGQTKWTTMASGRGRYDFDAIDNPKTVDWDSFPPFRDILRQACSERFIESLDHPLLLKLAGKTE
jgi:hypothetical protein